MPHITVADAPDGTRDPAALHRAFALLEGWTADGTLPGAAALVLHRGAIIGEAYLGTAQRGADRPVGPDTIWAVASVTKPFTATAVLLMVERGLLALDEPLADLLPEFLDSPDPAPARRAVTLRHCLAHCSGLPGFPPDNFALRQAQRPLTDFVRSWARQPLLFPPGALHNYSNVGILLAAEAVGRALDGTLRRRTDTPAIGRYHDVVRAAILEPLGMASSSLLPPDAWHDRIAVVSDTGQEGTAWEQANSTYYRRLGIPWGGLFSTPRDLARFLDFFLAAATDRPAAPRLLAPATARAMTTVQFAPPDAPADLAPELRDGGPPEQPRDAVPWGLGWLVKSDRRGYQTGDLTSPATFGHDGATGALVWADPARDLACIVLTNRAQRSRWHLEEHRLARFSNAVCAAV